MKIGTIGYIDHGKTTLTAAIKSVLEKQNYSVYKDAVEEVFEFKNPYHLLDKRSPSKSRINKCKKGLHEFMLEGKIKIDEHFYKEKWSCIHCSALMHNR